METHQQTSPTARRLSPGVQFLRGLIRAYQITLSPLMGAHCRFEPTCSTFALEALQVHGVARGTRLGVMRICRCHPWHPGGYDPVPPASSINNHDGTHTP